MGDDNGGKRGKEPSRNLNLQGTIMKDTWTKPKKRQDRGWEVGMVGVGGSSGRKMETIVPEQQ